MIRMQLLSGLLGLLIIQGLGAAPDVKPLYNQHCAACHGVERLGGMGPALLPGNLGRLKKAEAVQVIAEGRPATQMPGFAQQLSAEEITLLADLAFTAPELMPDWTLDDMRASQLIPHPEGSLPDQPRFEADLMNLFIVVELGDNHATLLDGDRFEPIHRFATRYALHGGPKYSADGRYVFFASRDGWISKFDIYNLKTVAEIRAGINTRNLAVSPDGRYVLVGNYLPHSLVLLDGRNLDPLRVIPVRDDTGESSRVSAVYTAPPRSSFIAALKDLAEVWEIAYPEATDSGAPEFHLRRIRLDDYLDDFFFDQEYRHLMGAARNAKNGQVVNLDAGRKVADLDLDGMPHLGSGITFEYQGRRVLATPHLQKSEVSVIDLATWKTIKRIKTLGPGFFMRSHENTPYAWVDVFFGPNKDAMHVIDKRSLEIVRTLRPEPGQTAAHVEFTRDGSHALVSLWEMEGALMVFDAATLEEVKRLPMRKPSGKYNVWNKTRYSEGTSH